MEAGRRWWPVESIFLDLPRVYLDRKQEKLFRNGVCLSLKNFSEIDGRVAVVATEKRVAVGAVFVETHDVARILALGSHHSRTIIIELNGPLAVGVVGGLRLQLVGIVRCLQALQLN